MIFNFSGIGVEKFQSGIENAYGGGNNETTWHEIHND